MPRDIHIAKAKIGLGRPARNYDLLAEAVRKIGRTRKINYLSGLDRDIYGGRFISK